MTSFIKAYYKPNIVSKEMVYNKRALIMIYASSNEILLQGCKVEMGFLCNVQTSAWISESDLQGCKNHCENHGTSILTYRDDNQRCVCCADSTSFEAYSNGQGNVYTNGDFGKGNNLPNV